MIVLRSEVKQLEMYKLSIYHFELRTRMQVTLSTSRVHVSSVCSIQVSCSLAYDIESLRGSVPAYFILAVPMSQSSTFLPTLKVR